MTIQVSFLSLPKQIKGTLVHNGYLLVSDLMKHFKDLDRLKTEPQLQTDQVEQLRQELARIKVLSDMLDRENPLEFSLSGPMHGTEHFMNSRRKKILLMKELSFIQPQSAFEEIQEDSFLDDVFGLGETTELCKLI